MTLNDKYCKLLDFDFGYDNQALADKIEKTSDEFSMGFTEWRLTTHLRNADQYTMKELLAIYKVKYNL